MGIKAYEFSNIRRQANNYNLKELENIMQRLLKIDTLMKTSMTDSKLLIERFLVEMGNGIYK